MGYQTVTFEEFPQWVNEYLQPPDFDASVLDAVDERETELGDEKGYLRLGFDDAYFQKFDGKALTFIVPVSPAGEPAEPIFQTAHPVAAYVPQPPETLAEAWQSEEWWPTFVTWCEDNHVDEMPAFLTAVETSYRPAPTVEWAQYIYDTFIADSGAKQVFIPADLNKAIASRLAPPAAAGAPPVPARATAGLFDAAFKFVWDECKSDYARFRKLYALT